MVQTQVLIFIPLLRGLPSFLDDSYVQLLLSMPSSGDSSES